MRHVTVELGGFDAEETEDDADAVGFFLLAEENDDAVFEDFFAQIDEVGESQILFAWS